MPDRRESTLLLLCSLSPASALRLAVPTAGVVTRRSRTTPVVALVAGDTLLTGQCLWFNTDKGFGFINVDGDEEELFVHHRDIYAYGFQSLDEGEPVEFFCAEDAKGRKRATDVTGPNGTYVRGVPALKGADDMFLTGTCMWFNVEKRFGFIDVHGHDEELFAHYKDIHAPPGVEATLADGELLEFRRAVGPQGKLRAVEITGPDGAYVQGRAPVSSDTVTGYCRWFDLQKGFGFIVIDGDDEDAFVHHKDIHAAGVQSLAHGEKQLEFRCIRDPNGRKRAIEVKGAGGAFVRGQSRVQASEWSAVWNATGWVVEAGAVQAVAPGASEDGRDAATQDEAADEADADEAST